MTADPRVQRTIAATRDDPDLRAGSEFLGGPAGVHAAAAGFWTPLRVVIAAGTAVFWIGFLRTYPCISNGWLDPDRYEAMCYSDIPVLYWSRGIAEGHLPIVTWPTGGQPLEYPPLTAVWMWLTGFPAEILGGGSTAFYIATVLGTFAFCLVALAATSLTVPGRPWDGMLMALSPAVLLASFINWDAAAVALTAVALLAWSRRRPAAAGVALALGGSFKLYPLLLLGPLLLLCWRAERLAEFRRTLVAAALAWAAVNIPFMIANFEGWSHFFRFSAERGSDFGSLWLLLDTVGWGWEPEQVNRAAIVLVVILFAAVAVLIVSAARKPRLAQAGFLVVAAFLLASKVYSPQFVLWLLPLAVLARPRWRDLMWWQLAEAVYFAAIWWHLVGLSGGEKGLPDNWYAAAILVHLLATAALCAVVVRDILRPEFDPVRADGDPRHRDDPGGGVLDQFVAEADPGSAAQLAGSDGRA